MAQEPEELTVLFNFRNNVFKLFSFALNFYYLLKLTEFLPMVVTGIELGCPVMVSEVVSEVMSEVVVSEEVVSVESFIEGLVLVNYAKFKKKYFDFNCLLMIKII